MSIIITVFTLDYAHAQNVYSAYVGLSRLTESRK